MIIALIALSAGPSAASLVGSFQTEHFAIRYTARAEGTAKDLAKRIEQVRSDFETYLGHDWPGVTEVRVGVGRDEFEQLCVGGKPPPWAAAIAFPAEHIVVLEARGLLAPDGDLTLRHELTHAALAELGSGWPRWFHEGLAMRLSGETWVVSQYAALFRGVTQDRLFHFSDLANAWPEQPLDVALAYAQSASFVGYLSEQHGASQFGELLERVHRGDPFETAFGKAFHSSLDVEELHWRQTLPSRYSWWPILTGEAAVWFLVACICVAAYARRRKSRERWRRAQELDELIALASALPGDASNEPADPASERP